MKTIAALTMVFLPATFVAVSASHRRVYSWLKYVVQTLFGMVFFTVESDTASGFRVNSLWWIYVAVTIPLTMLTVGAWLGWLRWVRWKRIQDEESLGIKEKSQ